MSRPCYHHISTCITGGQREKERGIPEGARERRRGRGRPREGDRGRQGDREIEGERERENDREKHKRESDRHTP